MVSVTLGTREMIRLAGAWSRTSWPASSVNAALAGSAGRPAVARAQEQQQAENKNTHVRTPGTGCSKTVISLLGDVACPASLPGGTLCGRRQASLLARGSATGLPREQTVPSGFSLVAPDRGWTRGPHTVAGPRRLGTGFLIKSAACVYWTSGAIVPPDGLVGKAERPHSGVHDGQIVPIDIVPEDGHMNIVARDFVSYLRVTWVNGRRPIGVRLLVSGGEYVG